MKHMRILAAVDRFPQDDAVLLRGLEIAGLHGVSLTIVHIVNLPGHATAPAMLDTFRGQAELAARDRIEAALRRHRIGSATTRIHIESGSPAQRLVELCAELRPGLIVMRMHHKPSIISQMLAPTTERVIAANIAPVLAVKREVVQPYDRVLLAIDGPDKAPAVLSFVAPLLPEAALHLVQAVEIAPQFEEAMLRVGLSRMELSAHHDVLAEDAENRLRSLAGDLVPGTTWHVLHGEPATELARATQGTGMDLIALGPGRSGLLRRAFLGSVTRRLLRDAACDVLVCRPLAAHTFGGVGPHRPAGKQATTNPAQLSK